MSSFESGNPGFQPELDHDQVIADYVKAGCEAEVVVLFGLKEVQRVAKETDIEIASYESGDGMIHLASLGTDHYREGGDAA